MTVPKNNTNDKVIRPAAFSGTFYPSSATELSNNLNDLFAAQPKNQGVPRLLISPHAGYKFSGTVAARGYSQVDPDTSTVFIIGPSHYRGFNGVHISCVDYYETPLGNVSVHTKIVNEIKESSLSVSVPEVEYLEHSLEVQLPFLQTRLKAFSIVPIIIGNAPVDEIARMIIPFIDGKTLVVASSDLSHFLDHSEACITDKKSIETILGKGEDDCIDSCGETAIRVLMRLAQMIGLKPQLLDLRTSFDTAPQVGSSRVVGYASVAYLDTPETDGAAENPISAMGQLLNDEVKCALLENARGSIRSAVCKEEFCESELPRELALKKLGCFVTLTNSGKLRGCIGCIEPVKPLAESVKENAVRAAICDPRFPPLMMGEIDGIHIEISILTQPQRVEFTTPEELLAKLNIGEDGVILKSGLRESTFLPQVWKQLPDKTSFLKHLSLKGGMGPDGWKTALVQVYKVIHFGEAEYSEE